MELETRISQIKTRQDLAVFISALREDLETNSASWENPSLPQFLDAMGAWVEVMDQVYKNEGLTLSEDQPWGLFATMLLAARIYE